MSILELTFKDTVLVPIRREAICTHCGFGTYSPKGIMLPSNPPQYEHICDHCQHVVRLGTTYPTIVYEEQPIQPQDDPIASVVDGLIDALKLIDSEKRQIAELMSVEHRLMITRGMDNAFSIAISTKGSDYRIGIDSGGNRYTSNTFL